jgi:hypothetical protein
MFSFIEKNKRYNENCKEICVLGRGSFGTVLKIPVSGNEVAVKILDLRSKKQKNLFLFVYFELLFFFEGMIEIKNG